MTNPWSAKIAAKASKAVERGEPYFEVLIDGRSFVSIMTIDVVGDNTLVYLTRAKAQKLIDRLQRAVDRLPVKKRVR